jgi:DNA modification methylase
MEKMNGLSFAKEPPLRNVQVTLLEYSKIERMVIREQIRIFRNELLLGDCLDVMPTLPDGIANTILTDPPFFVPAQQYVSRETDRWKRRFSDLSVLKGFFDQVCRQFKRLLATNGHLLIFCDPVSYPIFFQSAYSHFDITRCLVWHKGKHYFSLGQDAWRHSFELVLHARNSNAYYLQLDRQDVIECPVVPNGERLHPAQKPVKLLKELILACTPKDGLVLDAFCGSGSTLIACKELGFDFIGIEMDEQYYQISKNRLANIKTLDEIPFTTTTQEEMEIAR